MDSDLPTTMEDYCEDKLGTQTRYRHIDCPELNRNRCNRLRCMIDKDVSDVNRKRLNRIRYSITDTMFIIVKSFARRK